jgi:hypothetical protein
MGRHRVRKLISHVDCRKQCGNIDKSRWARWRKKFRHIWPEDVEVDGRLFHYSDSWDACFEEIVRLSDPNVTHASAARARAGRKQHKDEEAAHDGAS